MLYRTHLIKKVVRSLCWKIFNYIENNGNANMHSNGELRFLKELFKFYKEIQKVKTLTIFDVGANTGEYTALVLSESYKYMLPVSIHLFEPQKACFNTLQTKFLKYPNIKINNFALSDSEGIARIYYDSEGSGLASLHKRNLYYYKIEFNRYEEVQTTTLQKYIQENNLEKINLLKLDVEGHELKVLEGAGDFLNGDFIDFIQFEYGGANIDSRTTLLDFYNLLEIKGFVICKIMPKGLEPRTYSPYMENFVYQNYVAVSSNIYKILKL